uniref:Uncharacterized protein n=1 Tax=Octopus bimaculoides TaxID=37653 RepID=A0A0L8GSL0_OCTBM
MFWKTRHYLTTSTVECSGVPTYMGLLAESDLADPVSLGYIFCSCSSQHNLCVPHILC